MVKKYLALALLTTGFLLAGNAYGEDEIYYCATSESNGFRYDKETSSYERSKFVAEKFKMKLDRVSNQIVLVGDDGYRNGYTCQNPPSFRPELLTCATDSLSQFNFNANNGRFVRSFGFGYVGSKEGAEDHDSISVSYGRCDKF
jgi:hypothetical protein